MLGVSVCVACLATDVKMYSMSASSLLQPYKIIAGVHVQNEDMLEKLCWECAALVSKFNLFRHKCERAYLLLQDIYNQHDEISTHSFKKLNRDHHNLSSPYKVARTCTVEFVHTRKSKKSKKKHSNREFKADKNNDTETASVARGTDNDKTNNQGRTEPFVKVEVDIKTEDEDIKSEADEYVEMPVPLSDIFAEDELEVKPEKAKGRRADETSKSKRSVQHRRPRKSKAELRPKRVRKTTKLLASDFGMKEELLTQEQQMRVMRERRDAEGYASSRFQCALCYKAFNEDKAFSNHKLQHDLVSGELVCDICKVRYKTRSKLCKHISTHHMKKYSCRTCPAIFYNRSSALKHYAWHKGVVYTCHICGASFDKKTSHQNHLRIKHPSEHVCGACGEPFVSKMGLMQHVNKMHSLKRDTGVSGGESGSGGGPRCAECDIQFTSQQAWTRHILISPKHQHERHLCSLGCETCGETSPDAEALRAHRLTHRRARTIDSNTPINCEQCGEVMASSRAYHAHFRRAHPDKTRTQYPAMRAPCMCELCGKVFQDKVHLKLHTYTHTGERPFECDVCSKRFTTPDVLRIHVRSHTKELPYKCDICGQGFSNGANMKRHRVVHTDAKPYSCETCGKCFKYRTTVKSHTQFVHLKRPWPKRDRSKRAGERDEQPRRPRALQHDLLGFMAQPSL